MEMEEKNTTALAAKETPLEVISVGRAFGEAPPRSHAVLCARCPGEKMIWLPLPWFTWLNLRRQPMISFSMDRDRAKTLGLNPDDPLILAFPSAEVLKALAHPLELSMHPQTGELPDGVRPAALPQPCWPVPEARVVLRCTVSHSYNYPFQKVRIFNCNLEEALGMPETEEPD